jgi:hypothetical protein
MYHQIRATEGSAARLAKKDRMTKERGAENEGKELVEGGGRAGVVRKGGLVVAVVPGRVEKCTGGEQSSTRKNRDVEQG